MFHAVKGNELQVTFRDYQPDCLDEQIKRAIVFKGKDASSPDCISKPSNKPSQVLSLGVMALCPAEGSILYSKRPDDYLKLCI